MRNWMDGWMDDQKRQRNRETEENDDCGGSSDDDYRRQRMYHKLFICLASSLCSIDRARIIYCKINLYNSTQTAVAIAVAASEICGN